MESVVIKDVRVGGEGGAVEGEEGSERKESEKKEKEPATPSSLPCFSLLCCGQKQCDADVFAAVNDSGLVYDGGLVIDEVLYRIAGV